MNISNCSVCGVKKLVNQTGKCLSCFFNSRQNDINNQEDHKA